MGQGALECSHLRRFLAIALSPGASDVVYEHAAGVAANCSRLAPGRALLLEGSGAALQALAAALPAKSAVKRAGAAAAIKNVVVAGHQDGSFERVVAMDGVLEAVLVRADGLTTKGYEQEQVTVDP